MKIGITERGDAGIDFSWIDKHIKGNFDFSIIITKNIVSNQFYEKVKDIDNIIIHATITGLGGTFIEPFVPSYEKSIDGFKRIIDNFGQEKCVLRIDPVIPEWKYLENVYKILDNMKGYIKRVRFSFIDNYNHLKDRGLVLSWDSFNPPSFNQMAFYKSLTEYKNDFEFEVCAENVWGYDWIQQIGCVSEKDLKIFNLTLDNLDLKKQRPLCKCLASKTELLENKKQCPHGCLYCYWK